MPTIYPFRRVGNFTAIDNFVLDEILPSLEKPSSVRILLFIIRRTSGWQQEEATLSYKSIMHGTGIKSDHSVTSGIRELLDKGLVMRTPGSQEQAATFALNAEYEAEVTAKSAVPPTAKSAVPPTAKSAPFLKKEENTKKEEEKESPLTPLQAEAKILPSPNQKSVKQPGEPKDRRSQHPAIVAVWQASGSKYAPTEATWDSLIKTVGDSPDFAKLRACAEAWALKGGNPNNYSVWVMEWYVKGIPTNSEKSKTAIPENTPKPMWNGRTLERDGTCYIPEKGLYTRATEDSKAEAKRLYYIYDKRGT